MLTDPQKRYLSDPYTTRFSAAVVEVGGDDAHAELVLDESYFYPESGGQLCDAGVLGDLNVVAVGETDARVRHTVALAGKAAPVVGDRLVGEVDWARRFDHMQQHTGQHVLSRAFVQVADLDTVAFHMGDETCTIDLSGSFTDAAAAQAEDLANRVISENRFVKTKEVSVEEARSLDTRRGLPEGVTSARLVEVEDFDVIPCCGTHVRATGELALIKVLRWEKAKQNHRVYFVVGNRALSDYRVKHGIVMALGQRFTTGTDQVLSQVEKLGDELGVARKLLRRTESQLVESLLDSLLAQAEACGDAQWISASVESDDLARSLAGALREHSNVVGVVAAGSGTVLIVAAENLDLDVASVGRDAAAQFGARGGGKGGFAQFRVPREQVDLFIAEVKRRVVQEQ